MDAASLHLTEVGEQVGKGDIGPCSQPLHRGEQLVVRSECERIGVGHCSFTYTRDRNALTLAEGRRSRARTSRELDQATTAVMHAPRAKHDRFRRRPVEVVFVLRKSRQGESTRNASAAQQRVPHAGAQSTEEDGGRYVAQTPPPHQTVPPEGTLQNWTLLIAWASAPSAYHLHHTDGLQVEVALATQISTVSDPKRFVTEPHSAPGWMHA